MKRLTFLTSFTAILFFMSIFVYVAYRASIIGLTHDECNTYTILNPAGGGIVLSKQLPTTTYSTPG